jgi:hypothetical protein
MRLGVGSASQRSMAMQVRPAGHGGSDAATSDSSTAHTVAQASTR